MTFVGGLLIAVYAEIVSIYPVFQALHILSPVVVGIGDIFVAFGVATHCGVEIREIARVGKDGYENNPAGEDKNESAHDAPGCVIATVTLPVVKYGFGSEHVEEGKDWEEMSEADIEIARDAEVAVECDETKHGVLRDMRLERMCNRA